MHAVTKFNASCVIILGLLNSGGGVYFFGPGVGWTGSVASSKLLVLRILMARFILLDSPLFNYLLACFQNVFLFL